MGRVRNAAAVMAAAIVLAAGFGAARAALPGAGLQLSTSPSLYPAFSPAVTDYVTRCQSGAPMGVSVQTPPLTTASVNGAPARTGSFTASVPLKSGQEFSVAVRGPANQAATYYVRCLPPDFPTWSANPGAATRSQWYLAGPVDATFLGPRPPARQYVALFDNQGVPVWWLSTSNAAFFEDVLPDGNLVVTHALVNGHSGAEERRLDGSLVRSFDTVGSESDFHEFQLLANGDVLMAADINRHRVDLRPMGGPASADVLDQVVQEITPGGVVRWSWDALAHISPAEVDPGFRQAVLNGGAPYDIYHLNSIAAAGDDVVISFRHLSAVFAVDAVTGTVAWKLGGTSRAESLRVLGDPNALLGPPFAGQHDARILSDGTLTLHDNGTNHGRSPRAVRYALDPAGRTATLIEQVTDGRARSSLCCGSARKLSGGDWVIDWGFNNLITETTPYGITVFSLRLEPGKFAYRAVPVPYGRLSPAALRAGMDTQYRNSR